MADKFHIREVPKDDNFHSVRLFLQDVRNALHKLPNPDAGGDNANNPIAVSGGRVSVSTSSVTSFKRQEVKLTTESLAAAAQSVGTVPLGNTFEVIKIRVDGPSRVRLYSSVAFRDADVLSGRGVGVASADSEHGIILDIAIEDLITYTYALALGGTWDLVQNFIYALPGVQYCDLNAGVTAPPGSLVRVKNTDGSHPGHTMEFKFYDISHAAMGTIATGVDDAGEALAVVPVGAKYVGMAVGTYGGGSYTWEVKRASAFTTTTVSGYPITFVCSPEALGSNADLSLAQQIAYVVDNLHTAARAVVVAFTIIKEEL